MTSGLAIYDTMQYVRCPVSTMCLGMAASMGAVLLAAGHKGRRLALPNARIMIHQPLGGARGQATDIEIQAREIRHLKDVLTDILVERDRQAEGADPQGHRPRLLPGRARRPRSTASSTTCFVPKKKTAPQRREVSGAEATLERPQSRLQSARTAARGPQACERWARV